MKNMIGIGFEYIIIDFQNINFKNFKKPFFNFEITQEG